MRKRSFILLEILISLALLSILISFLFTSMAQGIKAEVSLSSARKNLLARQRTQSRLQDLFLSITPIHLPPLYTKTFPQEKKDSLIVYFDNGIDPDPLFSGPVLGRIYLDEKNHLALTLWPIDTKGQIRPWRKEILLDHVSHFQFQFLGQKQQKEAQSVNATLAWHKCWSKKRIETPSMIRLSVIQDEQEISFAFFLTTSEPFITYWEEGYHS